VIVCDVPRARHRYTVVRERPDGERTTYALAGLRLAGAVYGGDLEDLRVTLRQLTGAQHSIGIVVQEREALTVDWVPAAECVATSHTPPHEGEP
jgi:hypothetical protein